MKFCQNIFNHYFIFSYPTAYRHLPLKRGERFKKAFPQTINLAVLRLERFSLFKGKWRSQKGKLEICRAPF